MTAKVFFYGSDKGSAVAGMQNLVEKAKKITNRKKNNDKLVH